MHASLKVAVLSVVRLGILHENAKGNQMVGGVFIVK